MKSSGQTDKGSGSGCLLLIACAIIGIAAYFALVENANFPGARTIRTLTDEGAETYEKAKRWYHDDFRSQDGPFVTTPHAGAPPTFRASDQSNPQTGGESAGWRHTSGERKAVPDPAMRHIELKHLLLQLTNRHRAAAGVPPVKMGNNPAAQLHVEAALEGCYSSHWDRWGLKPNHRYTLAGGTGADAENGHGLDYCVTPSDGYSPPPSPERQVAEAVDGWMNSPGHRRSLLDPSHTEMNVGIAYDRFNSVMAQHFASDYVRYEQRPTIDSQGVITLSATVSGATLSLSNTVNVQIAYDPPPHALTKGQLSYTYTLCGPTPVAYVVEPLPPGWHFNDTGVSTKAIQRNCVDPYQTPAGRPAPTNSEEAHRDWAEAKAASEHNPAVQMQTVRVAAQRMTKTDEAIQLQADLSPILAHHGPGIYTVILWGRPRHMTEPTPLSEQAIFWKTQPPSGAPY